MDHVWLLSTEEPFSSERRFFETGRMAENIVARTFLPSFPIRLHTGLTLTK